MFPVLDHGLVKVFFGELLHRFGVFGRNMCRVCNSSILVVGVDELLRYLIIVVSSESKYRIKGPPYLFSKALDIFSRKFVFVFVDDIADMRKEL